MMDIKQIIARQDIDAFHEEFGLAYLHLAYHAAFPLALTPDLLYHIWANFQRDIHGVPLEIPWIGVADLLLSHLCQEIRYETYNIKSDAVRDQLLQRMRDDPRFGPQRIWELAEFMRQYVARHLRSDDRYEREFAQAQQWMAFAYTQPQNLIDSIAAEYTKPSSTPQLIRLAALLQTFREPVASMADALPQAKEDFDRLLSYSQGRIQWAQGDATELMQLATQVPLSEGKMQVGGTKLPMPEPSPHVEHKEEDRIPTPDRETAPPRPFYVERKEEDQIRQYVQEMEYVLLLGPRYQGKTTLLKHLTTQPETQDLDFVYVDVFMLDRSNEATWYESLVTRVLDQLDFIPKKRRPKTPTRSAAWYDFLSDMANSALQVDRRLALVLDEIEPVTIPNQDAFFGTLRSIYNARLSEKQFNYLTFILAGAFLPWDLNENKNVSPFYNIAHTVYLDDFDQSQVNLLLSQLYPSWTAPQVRQISERVFHWTDGHPDLTQLLGSYLEADATSADINASAERIQHQDESHLPPVLQQLDSNPDQRNTVADILKGERIKFSRVDDTIARLELLGVIKADEEGNCRIRNRIYERALRSSLQDLVTPTTPPKRDTLTVYPTSQLNLRAGPGTHTPVIATLTEGQALLALDDDARSRIGQHGAWLQVETESGTSGYVAAWYVHTEPFAQDLNFVDLEIRISEQRYEGYPVEITLGGQQEFLRGYLPADTLPWVSSSDLMADGQRLFETLFADSALRSAWAEARGQSHQRRIRLRIDPDAAELHALPWELLQEDSTMISAQPYTPFSRYLPIALPWGGPVEERPIRVLVVISSPNDLEEKYNLSPVDVVRERESLESTFAGTGDNDLQVDFLDPPATLERLDEKLHDGYHILHYLGHGVFNARRGQAALYLEDEAGNTQLLSDDAFAQMLARLGTRPRLVFLAADQSATRSRDDAFLGMAPKLVSVGVPAVVAMKGLITESATKFSATFYRRLLEHGQVDLAVNEARSTLLAVERQDVAVPVIFMRLKSGQLWGDEADARGKPLGAKPKTFWEGLIANIEYGECIPIIGPRVHGRWLPTPTEIARRLAERHEYPLPDRDDLAKVAQYVAVYLGESRTRRELLDTLMKTLIARLPERLRPEGKYDTLTDLIRAVGWHNLVAGDPNEVHRVLAELNLPLYLTTNPDSFMVEALRAQGKEPTREICPWREDLGWLDSQFEDSNYEPTPDTPLVYHLCGSDEEANSLVIKEDDYQDYLVRLTAERSRLPNTIRQSMSSGSLIFLGYDPNDRQFKTILQQVMRTLDQRFGFRHVFIWEAGTEQTPDAEAYETYFQRYFQDANITVYRGSPRQFMAELYEHWEDYGAKVA